MSFIPALKYHFLTPYYDRFILFWMPELEVKHKAISLVNIEEGDLVLDFGCGTGVLIQIFENKYSRSNIIGLDVDPRIVKIAKNKGIKEEKLILFDGGEIPFPDAYFDKVISTWVFHHLSKEDKIRAFNEIKRVLKEDGLFVIADWGKPANVLMRSLFFVVQVIDNFRTTSDNVKDEIPKLLKAAGFSNTVEMGLRNTFFGTLRYWVASQ